MPITFIPKNGGYWKNGTLQGGGVIIDTNNSIIKKGTFNRGKLNGNNCLKVDYSGATLVNIRVGIYANDKENGQVYEYVFAKSLWDDFLNLEEGVDSTRYTQIFNNGVWVSTSETVNNKKVKGSFVYVNSKLNDFTFEEVV